MSNETKLSKYIINFKDIPYERISIERVLTDFPDLDYHLKGIGIGITEILGETNVGKSLLSSMFIDAAIDQKYKVAVFAGEHSLKEYKMLLMQMKAIKGEFVVVPFMDNRGKNTNISDFYVSEEKEEKLNAKYNDNLFMFDVRQPERDIDTLISFINECNKELGIRYFMFDNLMEIDNNSQNQYQEQASILTKLRNLALRKKLFIILVMHTNKGVSDNFRMTIKNAYGSSFVTNKGYNVIAIYRKDYLIIGKGQEKSFEKFKNDITKNGFNYDECDSFIDILKTKGNSNGIVGLVYDKDSKSYKQGRKITQTEADKIYKQTIKQSSFADCESIDDEELPF